SGRGPVRRAAARPGGRRTRRRRRRIRGPAGGDDRSEPARRKGAAMIPAFPAAPPRRPVPPAETDPSWTRLLRRVPDRELGMAPVICVLLLIWAVFGLLNPAFLSAENLVNLTLQSAPTGVIALGVVLV